MRTAYTLLAYLGLVGWVVGAWALAEGIAARREKALAAAHLRIAIRVVEALRAALASLPHPTDERPRSGP